MADNVTVADAIKQLRAQLEEAQREGAQKDVRFLAKSVEVEFGIVFKSEREAGAGIKAWFLDVSGKSKAGDETAHKIKLVLTPVGRDGKDMFFGDDEHETQ
jgi:hypothetical protein